MLEKCCYQLLHYDAYFSPVGCNDLTRSILDKKIKAVQKQMKVIGQASATITPEPLTSKSLKVITPPRHGSTLQAAAMGDSKKIITTIKSFGCTNLQIHRNILDLRH